MLSYRNILLGSLTLLIMIGISTAFIRSFTPALKKVESQTRRMSTSAIKPLVSTEFQKILKGKERANYQIVDVREVDELEQVRFPGDDIINLPLSQANTWSNDVLQGKILDQGKPTICVCHHGARSYRVANFLASQAQFDDVYNLEGGIHAYATEVDPSIGTY